MKYYIIAGEASGDLHASNLIRNLKIEDKDADFRCWGGDLMEEQGAKIVKHYRDLDFMGFVEVLMNIRTIAKNISFCKKDILEYKPDVLILVDYPGFNLRIAEFAYNNNIKVFYYISPQIWAWKQSRIHKIKKYVDKMFVILPFEKDFYAKFDYEVDFVGHPLLDAIENNIKISSKEEFVRNNNLSEQAIIAILPGSRKQEISRMLKTMVTVIEHFPDYQFVIGGAKTIDKDYYNQFLNNEKIKLVFGQTYDLMKHADAGLITSGTATLEAAIFELPEVVCYKANHISYLIAKSLVKIKFISLANLIMDREIICELIQNEFNTNRLIKELKSITDNGESKEKLFSDYKILKEKLGGSGASASIAKLMWKYLNF